MHRPHPQQLSIEQLKEQLEQRELRYLKPHLLGLYQHHWLLKLQTYTLFR
jgi:hypothetical protein